MAAHSAVLALHELQICVRPQRQDGNDDKDEQQDAAALQPVLGAAHHSWSASLAIAAATTVTLA